MHVYEVHTHEMHACEVHTYEVHAHKVHAREVHAYEMQMTPIQIDAPQCLKHEGVLALGGVGKGVVPSQSQYIHSWLAIVVRHGISTTVAQANCYPA
jgi:hypothetical protein